MTKAFNDLLGTYHLISAHFFAFIYLLYAHAYCSSLASTNQATTSTRTKTYHTLSPVLFLADFGFRQTIGVQAILNPVLYKAPQGSKKQVVQGGENKQFKNAKGWRT